MSIENTIVDMDPVESSLNALVITKGATLGERLLVLCDQEQKQLGELFAEAGLRLGLWTKLSLLETTSETRREPDDYTKLLLTTSEPDLIVNVFRRKDEETSYRIKIMRIERNLTDRILHCPGITYDMFTEGAAALTQVGYEEMFNFGYKLKDILKGSHKVHVTCGRGSDFTLDLGGKEFQVEHGTNIPTGEINVMPPIGDSFEGKLVSISGGTGKLYTDTPATIVSRDGLAGDVLCEDNHVKTRIVEELDRDSGARYLGEFAIGINKKARIVDSFIEAEKVLGTIHVAFGGSYRPSKTHLDLLINKPTVTVYDAEGNPTTIMTEGRFSEDLM